MLRSALAVALVLSVAFPSAALAQAATATPVPASTPAAAPVATPVPAKASATPAPAIPAPEPVAAPAQGASAAAARKGEDVITPMGAVWRSTLVPGWGQRYKGEKTKGWLFTGIAGGMLIGTLAAGQLMQDADRSYHKLDGNDPASSFDSAHRDWTNKTVAFDMLAGFTTAFWAYNVIEGGFTPLEHLRIKDARVKDVFPAMNKFYETNPIATISVENRSSEPVTKVKVKFEANDIMDVPAESEIVDIIPPGLGKSVNVTAAFSPRMMDVGASEPKSVAAKITIEYEVGKKKRSITRTANFTVYNRNAIVWDDMRKLASFVTPREEGVKSFASLIAQKQKNISSVKSISTAAAYFDAISAFGLVYVSDPQAPFAYFDGNAEAVDGVNYPRETLSRKTGDCDDLTALYASLLESSGIATAFVDVPGHVFLMFDSGLTPDEMRTYLGGESGYLPRNGTAWIPVEVTAVGKSFNEARQIGATEVKKWSGLNQLKMVDVAAAQTQFPPSPPNFKNTVAAFTPTEIQRFEGLVSKDASVLLSSENSARSTAIASVKARKLSPAAEDNEIGIVFARDGKLKEAVEYFNNAKTKDPQFSKAYNNLGNIAYLQNRTEDAKNFYKQALSTGGENAPILANLANLYFEEGNAKEAKAYFERAVRMEPVYEKEYPEIAALLRGDGSKVAATGGSGPGKAAGIGVGGKDPRKSRWIP